jgi:hypothetical protein
MAVAPFDVTYTGVADERLSDLLAATNAAGFETPALSPVSGRGSDARVAAAMPSALAKADPRDAAPDLPASWRLVREMPEQTYTWPTYVERYPKYRVYAGDTGREGTVHVALGTAEPRVNTWGRDRVYVVAFLTSGSPQTALAEFLETDDFESTREFIAVIRGRDGAGSKKMFGPGDSLPSVYAEHFKTVVYSDQIRAPGSWAKIGVLAHEDEPETMLNHALLQARRRGDL